MSCAELRAVGVGVLPEHGHGALVLPALELLEVDAVAVEQAMEIRDLREHPDRAEDRERRGEDAVGHARHHVAPARRDAVHAHGERDAALAHPHELGCGKAVVVHEPAGALEAYQHLVLGPGVREHRGHFLAERRYRARADVALEVEHEDPGAVRAAPLGAGPGLALAGLRRRLAFLAAEEPALQDVLHLAVARPQIADFEPFRTGACAAARGESGDEEDQGGDGRDDGERLGQEQRVLQQIVEHRAGSRAE